MLREIYAVMGGIGTFITAIAFFVSAVAWLMALTGTVLRSGTRFSKTATVLVISLFPPLSIPLLALYLYQDKSRTAISAEKTKLIRAYRHHPSFAKGKSIGSEQISLDVSEVRAVA